MEKVYENCVALYNYYTYLVLFVHINIYTPLYKFMLVRKWKNISPRIQSQRFLPPTEGRRTAQLETTLTRAHPQFVRPHPAYTPHPHLIQSTLPLATLASTPTSYTFI